MMQSGRAVIETLAAVPTSFEKIRHEVEPSLLTLRAT
jgi:hypothetical protein